MDHGNDLQLHIHKKKSFKRNKFGVWQFVQGQT
jgi:hypothetical protein